MPSVSFKKFQAQHQLRPAVERAYSDAEGASQGRYFAKDHLGFGQCWWHLSDYVDDKTMTAAVG